MKNSVLAITFAAALAIALPATASAQVLIKDYLGFDYEDPNPNPGTFGEPLSGYHGVGFVPVLSAPLVSNPALFEYTYEISGLTPASVTPVGPFAIINYGGPGLIRVYEDPISGGTAADYGSNPPSALSPVTFVDGTLYLEGNLTSFRFVLNTVTQTGSYEAVVNLTAGSNLNDLPLSLRSGWTFSGSTGNALNIPAGYAHQIDGQMFLEDVTPTAPTTWGRLKSLYR